MNSILKKLGLADQDPVLILNAPDAYREVMGDITAQKHEQISGKYKFIQIFAENLTQAHEYAKQAIDALDGDGHLWLCYPKGTSKKYKTDINRNKAWDVFSPYEFEPVTQVSIDDDWSAMRFRYVDYIKTMKRKTASTEKGKQRISGKE